MHLDDVKQKAARLTTLSRSVAGKRVLVTGAASGMGRATAFVFADEGARVAVVDLSAERVLEVVDEIRAVHGPDAAHGFVADVGDHESLKRLVVEVVATLGGIDVLARSLLNAVALIEDGGLARAVENRYAGWNTAQAQSMLAPSATLADIADGAVRDAIDPQPHSGKQELLENTITRFI
mgnify:CR=1 FL=1